MAWIPLLPLFDDILLFVPYALDCRMDGVNQFLLIRGHLGEQPLQMDGSVVVADYPQGLDRSQLHVLVAVVDQGHQNIAAFVGV